MTIFDNLYRHTYKQLNLDGIAQGKTQLLLNNTIKWDCNFLPLLTLRRVNIESLTRDLLWQLSGASNVNTLGDKKFIWEEWADDQGFLESSYGRHIRKSPSYHTYIPNEKVCGAITNEPFFNLHTFELDQIRYVFEELKSNPLSRRAVIDIWNPANATVANQPPCLLSLNFNLIQTHINQYKLITFVTMRSTDFGLGFVFDIMHYYLIAEMLRENLNQTLNVSKGNLYFNSHNFHVYDNQLPVIDSFINLDATRQEPTADIEYFDHNGFLEPHKITVENYHPHPFVRVPFTIN